MYRCLLACLIAAASFSISANELDLGLRSRIAYLEDGNDAGRAVTSRLRLGWDKQWQDHWSTDVELDLVQGLWRSDFSDGVHFNGEPMMPDPEGVDLNELRLHYHSSSLDVNVGRQVINLGNERFVGSNSFWQNEQSFDAVQIAIPLFAQSQVFLIYLDRALRIFGKDAGTSLHRSDINYAALEGRRPLLRLGKHDLEAYLFEVKLGEWDYHKVNLFYHAYGNETHRALSNNTAGVSHRFKYRLNRLRFESELTAARQERTKISGEPSTDYYQAKASLAKNSFTIMAEYESLSSTKVASGAVSFITPLASLHEYQGWADVFTTTPAEGVTDGSFAIQWKATPWRVKVIYHRFYHGNASEKYGHELDLDMVYKPSKNHMFHLRAAEFSVDDLYQETFDDRVRVFFTYSYTL